MICPKKHGTMKETPKRFFCQLCGFEVVKEIIKTTIKSKSSKVNKEGTEE